MVFPRGNPTPTPRRTPPPRLLALLPRSFTCPGVELEKGKNLGIKLTAAGQLDVKEATREVFFEFNGMPRSVKINDRTAQSTKVVRAKAADVPGGSRPVRHVEHHRAGVISDESGRVRSNIIQ